MPAASEDVAGGLPRTWRPLGPLVVGLVLVISVGVVSGMCWISLGAQVQAEFTLFQLSTLAFIALLILGCVHAIGRSRVVATVAGLRIVNGYRRRDLPWTQITGVRLPSGAPWLQVDLADGETLPAMGIQASDGARARQAVADLRTLVAQYGGEATPVPPHQV